MRKNDDKSVLSDLLNNSNLKKLSISFDLMIDSFIFPFAEIVKNFINDFSQEITHSNETKNRPELVALAYWMRLSQITKLERDFRVRNEGRLVARRGVVLHFAPSNVDTIFVYSLFLSLLMGNKNIVRVSFKKNSIQQQAIIVILNRLLSKEKYRSLAEYLFIVTYEHSDEITRYLSSVCDVRVIWGGDETVNLISQYPIPSKSTEVKFASKYSISLLSSAGIEKFSDKQLSDLAYRFVNDCYWYGQLGCSSPRTVIWWGDICEEVVSIFWKKIFEIVYKFEHGLTDADFINKYVVQCDIASLGECKNFSYQNLVNRIVINDLVSHDIRLHCGAGLFFEFQCDHIQMINKVMSREIQTITYEGFTQNELNEIVSGLEMMPDRVVPVGQALNFDSVWDGMDLLSSFSRLVTLK